jgi:hypothetical protein
MTSPANFPDPVFNAIPPNVAVDATAHAFFGILLVGLADGSVRSLNSTVMATGVVQGFPTVSIWSWACTGPNNPIAGAPTPSGW